MGSERVADAYYADVRYMELLTPTVEHELFAAYRTCVGCQRPYTEGALQTKCPNCGRGRNLRAREKLVQGALRFVVKMARDYARRAKGDRHSDELLLNLISAGNLGLLVAVDRFVVERGTRFLTYAAWWVREKILEELDNMGVVRVPAYQQKAQRARWKQASGDMEPPHVTLTALDALDKTPGGEPLEEPLLKRYGAATVSRVMLEADISLRDRYAIMLYLGSREDPKTLKQIASRVGYSPERTRILKREVMDTLRRALDEHYIDELSDVF